LYEFVLNFRTKRAAYQSNDRTFLQLTKVIRTTYT